MNQSGAPLYELGSTHTGSWTMGSWPHTHKSFPTVHSGINWNGLWMFPIQIQKWLMLWFNDRMDMLGFLRFSLHSVLSYQVSCFWICSLFLFIYFLFHVFKLRLILWPWHDEELLVAKSQFFVFFCFFKWTKNKTAKKTQWTSVFAPCLHKHKVSYCPAPWPCCSRRTLWEESP